MYNTAYTLRLSLAFRNTPSSVVMLYMLWALLFGAFSCRFPYSTGRKRVAHTSFLLDSLLCSECRSEHFPMPFLVSTSSYFDKFRFMELDSE